METIYMHTGNIVPLLLYFMVALDSSNGYRELHKGNTLTPDDEVSTAPLGYNTVAFPAGNWH